MNRLVLSVLALSSLSLVACAGDLADDADVGVALDVAAQATAADTDSNTPPPSDAAEKGKKKGKGSSEGTYLIVKMQDVLVSSY